VWLPIWSRYRSFFPRAEITGPTAHRPVPTPFPVGELFDSPGFAAPRLPWVRDIHTVPEPCRGSLHASMTQIGRYGGFRNGFGESHSALRYIPMARFKPSPSEMNRNLDLQPRVVLCHRNNRGSWTVDCGS